MAPHAAPPSPPGTPTPHRPRPRDSVRPRLTHRLVFKFYLWLLLALTLSILSAGSFFYLVSWRGVETRLMERAFSIVTSARDVTGNLLASGLPAAEAERILAPLIRQGRTALAVVNEGGIPVLLLTAPGALPPGWPPSAARVRAVLQSGGGIEPGEGPHMGANLPIDLPGGGRGAMFVLVRRTDWRADHPRFQLWAGLAVILGMVWLLSWPLAAHLTRPLRRLADAAERLGSGDLTIRSDATRSAGWPTGSTAWRTTSSGWCWATSNCSPTSPTSCGHRWPACGWRWSWPARRQAPLPCPTWNGWRGRPRRWRI